MNQTKKTVIIVAGGSGSRMQSELPKQFILVADKSIIEHTIEAFLSYSEELEFIIVLPEIHVEEWGIKLKQSFPNTKIAVCVGGATRTESVKNGLSLCVNDGIVAIHDAARPFVSSKLISNCFTTAEKFDACIPCIPCNDSTRIITDESENNSVIDSKIESKSFDRNKLLLVQTPQCFKAAKLKSFYATISKNFSDDASLWEASGEKIYVCEGETQNIKITTPIDLLVAKAILTKKG